MVLSWFCQVCHVSVSRHECNWTAQLKCKNNWSGQSQGHEWNECIWLWKQWSTQSNPALQWWMNHSSSVQSAFLRQINEHYRYTDRSLQISGSGSRFLQISGSDSQISADFCRFLENWTNPQGVINGCYVFFTSFLSNICDVKPFGFTVAELREVTPKLKWNSQIILEGVNRYLHWT